MPLKKMLEDARDTFTDAMGSSERFSIGVNERAKRLKQAMFPDEIKPGEVSRSAADEAEAEAAQSMIENRSKKRR